MVVRLRHTRRIARDTFRLTLDLVEPEQRDWEVGDCVVQMDLVDAPGHHAVPRGPLGPALDCYRLAPDTPPGATDSRLLWDMGHAVDAFIRRVFEAGVLCPFQPALRDGAPERAE